MKKVLFISNHAGFSKFNVPYMRLLQSMGFDVHNASPGIEVEFTGVHIDTNITRSPLSLSNLGALIKLLRYIKQEDIRYIHCHTPAGGIIGRLLKVFKRELVVIYTAHGFHFYHGGSILGWFLYYPVELLLSYLTDVLVLINEEDFSFSKKQLRAQHVYKINGVGLDLTRFRILGSSMNADKRDTGNNELVFIYVAQFIERKNHEYLLREFSKYYAIESKAKLLLLGEGPLVGRVKLQIEDLGLSDAVVMHGYKSNIQDYYQLADVVLSVSKQEGFGMNLVEGLACGLTIVASRVRGHIDICEQLNNQYLFDLRDNALFETLKDLNPTTIRDAEIRMKNADMAECFELQASITEMKKIYCKHLRISQN